MIYDYIIIGGGISGMYSAYLLNKDYKVLVLEKNDYIGGRMKDIIFHGETIKLGAGIGQEKNKNLLNLLKLLKIHYKVGKANKTIVGKKIDFDINHAITLIKKKYYELKKANNMDIYKLNVGKFLGKYFGKKFKSDYIKYSGYNDYIKSDMTYHIKYYPIEDHSTRYSNKIYLMWSDLINKLKQNISIKLNTNVSNVMCKDNTYSVYTKDTTYYSKKIIFALSIIPLNYFMKKLQCEINYMKYIGVMKYMRIYTYHKNGHNFKSNMVGGYNILIDRNPLQKIIVISDKILMAAYCDNMNAIYWEKMQQNELKKKLLYWLRKVVPCTTEIDDVVCKLWDEAVHYYKPNNNIKTMVKKLQQPMENVYVVGEVVSMRHGWVEGAISSVNSIINNIIK